MGNFIAGWSEELRQTGTCAGCLTEPLTCGVCTNSGQLVSELKFELEDTHLVSGELENWLVWKEPTHLLSEVFCG